MDIEKDVPFKVYESAQARADKRFKMMWILLIIVFVAFVGSNTGWLIYESQYEDTVTTIDAQQDGSAVNIVGGGNITYGTEGTNNNEEKNP